MSGLDFVPVNSPEQIGRIASLAEEIWSEHYASILEEAQIRYMLDNFQSPGAIAAQIAEKGYRYYLLTQAGVPAGYVGMQPEEGKLFLSKLYLRREARGQGLSRRITAFLEGFAAAGGLSAVWLTVNRQNPSVEIYKKLGFAVIQEQVADIGGGYVMDDYIMEKAL